MLEKIKEHPLFALLFACIVSFFLFHYGYVDKGDVKSLVHDASELTHEFKDFVKDIFSHEDHKAKSDSTTHKEK